MTFRTYSGLLLALWAIAGCASVQAQNNAHIGELSYFDRQYMQEQRAVLTDLVARSFGGRFSGNKNNDLGLLQNLLDKSLVRPDQTRELQAMGVIMGDLLAADLGMHWVIYEDRAGRNRALRYQASDNYLFPVTMISRRREVDNRTPVADIYQKAHDIIASRKPELPFQ
jgi:hypothetical protein